MIKNTFDTYKSINHRLHNVISINDQYQGYLHRIDKIVDRKNRIDNSPSFYMTFLNKSRQKSKHQKSLERDSLIQLENKHLLTKIQKAKNRKFQVSSTLHEIHMYEKRIREQQRINQQNGKMAKRIMNQNSYLAKNKLLVNERKSLSPQKGLSMERSTDMNFFDSRIKKRKLPKLIKSPSTQGLRS